MAQAPVLHDFDLSLNHVDRGLTQALKVRTARHSSETSERVWLRLLAYCLHWEERLAFGPGLSDPDAPDLLATDLTGQTTLWLRVGKADPAKVRRAADQNGRARVAVLFESEARLEQFKEAVAANGIERLERVELAAAPSELLSQLATPDARRAKVTVTIVGDHLYVERDGVAFDGPIVRGAVGR